MCNQFIKLEDITHSNIDISSFLPLSSMGDFAKRIGHKELNDRLVSIFGVGCCNLNEQKYKSLLTSYEQYKNSAKTEWGFLLLFYTHYLAMAKIEEGSRREATASGSLVDSGTTGGTNSSGQSGRAVDGGAEGIGSRAVPIIWSDEERAAIQAVVQRQRDLLTLQATMEMNVISAVQL